MRIAGIQLVLIVGGVLGVLSLVLIGTHGDEGVGNIDVPTSIHDAGADPGKDRITPNAATGNDQRESPNTAKESQAHRVETAGVGQDGAQAQESQLPIHSAVTNEVEEDVHLTETVPFRPSRSIQERCRTRPAPTADSCKEVSELLEEMSREDRDVEWATRTESRIRGVVSAREDGTRIRALECKISLCAIETVSSGNVGFTILRQAEQESAGVVDDGDYVLAWEEDLTHGRVIITQRVFSRRVQ